FEGGDVINKIFRQRLDDPEPLENIARGVPAAFAAMVRKLMAKKPDERYQTCKELRADMARWTDPTRLRAILGAEAEAARSFHPPPPPLADEDLRLLSIADDTGPSVLSLRDLGDAEPSPARSWYAYLAHQRRQPLAPPFFPDRPGTGPDRHPHDRPTSPRLMAGDAGAGVLRQPAG